MAAFARELHQLEMVHDKYDGYSRNEMHPSSLLQKEDTINPIEYFDGP